MKNGQEIMTLDEELDISKEEYGLTLTENSQRNGFIVIDINPRCFMDSQKK